MSSSNFLVDPTPVKRVAVFAIRYIVGNICLNHPRIARNNNIFSANNSAAMLCSALPELFPLVFPPRMQRVVQSSDICFHCVPQYFDEILPQTVKLT